MSSLKEYVWQRTEKMLPNARTDTRDDIRKRMCEYAEWLARPRSLRGEPPTLSIKYRNQAGDLYSQFLTESEDRIEARPKIYSRSRRRTQKS